MYLKSMEELQQDQELLRAEVSELKIQMNQIMEILQVLLKKECNIPPIITKQVNTPLAFSVATPTQGKPYVMSCDSYFEVEKETPVCFPQLVLIGLCINIHCLFLLKVTKRRNKIRTVIRSTLILFP